MRFNEKLTDHFAIGELACHCKRHTWKDRSHLPPGGIARLRQTANFLEKLRERFNSPIHVFSCYRCPSHNKAVGGVKGSIHLIGKAADIKVIEIDPQTVQQIILDEFYGNLVHGLGAGKSYTHVDWGDRIAKWKYRRGKSVPWY